jgi:hypothetical protein
VAMGNEAGGKRDLFERNCVLKFVLRSRQPCVLHCIRMDPNRDSENAYGPAHSNEAIRFGVAAREYLRAVSCRATE